MLNYEYIAFIFALVLQLAFAYSNEEDDKMLPMDVDEEEVRTHTYKLIIYQKLERLVDRRSDKDHRIVLDATGLHGNLQGRPMFSYDEKLEKRFLDKKKVTGYLPDSVYRELAWYGILQIQPLHHSSKFKVAAHLIWQHTLGRPHVIMENPPQSTQSPGKVSRQILAEEAAKWSREQRAAQEMLMENIKSGGNGLTVRTVVGRRNRTVYIIQNGNYYKCPGETEPDLVAYRVQGNMHERGCTNGEPSEPIAIDPCIEAETAPIEYSFMEGWMFCLGDGERASNNYFKNGTLDCGNKTKVSFEQFLDLCAFDNNIVITFEYFGDEPRKDIMHNATLCTSWDPCRLSYLYRLEPPSAELLPALPTSSQDPCEATVCPECLEGNEGEDQNGHDPFENELKPLAGDMMEYVPTDAPEEGVEDHATTEALTETTAEPSPAGPTSNDEETPNDSETSNDVETTSEGAPDNTPPEGDTTTTDAPET